ncbi:MAG: PAS domain-containing protein [Jaaginema sp. PMC 1079.18]|nr:PAS domain-containing protein [Jaaginema sp. PMC 1079.18]
MTPDQFLAFARVFPEPLLLISDAGEVLAANPATARILNCRRQELAGKQLPELVQEPAQKVLGYLKNCSRSRQFTIGSLTFLQAEDENVICRIEGAVCNRNLLIIPQLLYCVWKTALSRIVNLYYSIKK